MKSIFLIIAVLYSNYLLGQDSTNCKLDRADEFIINIPHSTPSELQISSFCLDKKKHSSCVYFYTPSQEKKAEGKQNSEAIKVGK